MDVSGFIRHLLSSPFYKGQVAHESQLPPREAAYGDLEYYLDSRLIHSLESSGRAGLYSHQARAINALLDGRNVIVATPAASGKSLCYHVPVLDALLRERDACALYLFPTKALTQDQLRSLGDLVKPDMGVRYASFDGDTPGNDRAEIRRSARLLLTNPDMLHLGILPNHRSWGRLLRGLRYVVIDEAHVYRGVFGSHLANVVRRLRRLCAAYGSSPQFVLSSATIANPGEHAQAITGLPFEVVDEDGSPYGGKDFIFWNPPLIDARRGMRRSANTEVSTLMTELLKAGVRSLAFVRSRRLAELLYTYVRGQLRQEAPDIAHRVAPYRASYLPEARRETERQLFQGELLGVVATNALELDIDIGDLDATILNGYPGSIASKWQQAGRSGRRGEGSLSFLVAVDNPLDQHLMRHPEAFFDKSHEQALTSQGNPHILGPHLLCAAYEAPLGESDAKLFGSTFSEVAAGLEERGLLRHRQGQWHLDVRTDYPAQDVNIRSATSEVYTLVEEETGRVLETMGGESAFFELHPGAVYLHRGEPYIVVELDLMGRTAYASSTDVPYYTQPRNITDIRILNVRAEKRADRVSAYLGDVEVSTTVVGYKKKAHLSEEILGDEVLDLPPRIFRTAALWFDIPEDSQAEIRRLREDLAGGLHGAEHAAIGILPLFALCDRNDIGGVSTPLHPDTGRPQVFIYDGHQGGVGIAERGYEIIEELWEATLRTVQECPCQDGCPSCIQSPKCGNNNQPLDKGVTIKVLRGVLGA